VRSIAVVDRHGDEFTLFELRDRRFLRIVRQLKLETGELVDEVDGALIVVGTGEKLVPVGNAWV
jgi:hypothetical protein